MAKIKPTPLTLHYTLTETVNDGASMFYYYDLWRDISAVSRRMNRQGKDLAIAGIRIMSNHSCDISVARLPPTWVTYEAWEASFRAWQRLNRMAQESSDTDINARYRDFKVYFDSIHAEAATSALADSPVPVGVAATIGNASVAYEWQYSRIEFPEDTGLATQQLHMIGGNDTSGSLHTLGVIHNYALARARPNSSEPNVPVSDLGAFGDSYLNTMFDFGDSFDDVISEAVEANNEPPYPVGLWPDDPAGARTEEFYPGGANFMAAASQHEIASTSIYNNFSSNLKANGFIGGFVAPLGLVQMELYNPNSGSVGDNLSYVIDVYVDLLPGPANGVMGRSMLEGN